MKQHKLKLQGLGQPTGHIRSSDLNRTIRALSGIAKRTTLLLATGTSQPKGSKFPAWVNAATDFVITDFTTGSTTIEVEAPLLIESEKNHFIQKDLWAPNVEIGPNDSAIDLVCDAVAETRDDDSQGFRYDSRSLAPLLQLLRLGINNDPEISISSKGDSARQLILSRNDFLKISQLQAVIPKPSVHLISGVLDQVQYSDGCFQIEIEQGKKISGKISSDHIDKESIRPLWGKDTMVEGTAYFTVNGDIRMIEAHFIGHSTKAAEHFRHLPSAPNHPDFRTRVLEANRDKLDFDFLELGKLWPGDEPVEELLDLLKEL